MSQQRSGQERPTQTQRRRARHARREAKQRFKRVGSIVGLGLLGIVIIAGLAISGVPTPDRGFQRATEGPGIVMPDQGQDHLDAVGATVPVDYYNSTPPTSGLHALAPATCGAFDQPVPDETQVHNLEHGFVVINYHLEDQAAIDELTAIAEGLPGWPAFYILAPHREMETPIALTAWQVIQRLDAPDAEAIREFANAYRVFGPEVGVPGC